MKSKTKLAAKQQLIFKNNKTPTRRCNFVSNWNGIGQSLIAGEALIGWCSNLNKSKVRLGYPLQLGKLYLELKMLVMLQLWSKSEIVHWRRWWMVVINSRTNFCGGSYFRELDEISCGGWCPLPSDTILQLWVLDKRRKRERMKTFWNIIMGGIWFIIAWYKD
jgi:hypothetical protein